MKNHWSACQDEGRVRELLEEEVRKGFVEKFEGREEDLRKRFPPGSLAVGKLGLVRKEGKEDRLIGDSKSSKASPQAKFCEKVEVPSIGYFSEALDRGAAFEHAEGLRDKEIADPDEWILLSIDVKTAHKSIRTASEDVGFAVFTLMGTFYIYLVNHFGAAWSAYWWARLGALILRVCHFTLRHKHLGAIYVDDFLWLLPRKAFAPMVCVLVGLLQVLGVPLSWRKLRLGTSLAYLGWLLGLRGGFVARMSEDKKSKILKAIAWWLLHPRRVRRSDLREFLGLLVWATQINLNLRPFLAPLFSVLHRPCMKLQNLSISQVAELRGILCQDSLMVQRKAALSDVQQGWQLVGVGNQVAADPAALRAAVRQPCLKNGGVWVRFKAWPSTTEFDPGCVRALRLLKCAVAGRSKAMGLRMPGLLASGQGSVDGSITRMVVSRGFICRYCAATFLKTGSARQT